MAAQRNQVPEFVVIDEDRLQQRIAILADIRNFRRIEVNEGLMWLQRRDRREALMLAEEANSAA